MFVGTDFNSHMRFNRKKMVGLLKMLLLVVEDLFFKSLIVTRLNLHASVAQWLLMGSTVKFLRIPLQITVFNKLFRYLFYSFLPKDLLSGIAS